MFNKNESDLRKKIETLMLKLSESETQLREKEENMFSLNSERLNLICDIKNLKTNEECLKYEIQ